MTQKVRSVPGVRDVTITDKPPMEGFAKKSNHNRSRQPGCALRCWPSSPASRFCWLPSGSPDVVSYSVAQRVREIAIRLALGASPVDLLKLVIGKMMLIVLVGLALGGSAALALPRVLASLLYATSPADRVTWVVAGGCSRRWRSWPTIFQPATRRRWIL